ncbi:MAG: hypothetical protein M0Z69_08135 [Actinomycetota bacterium]|nr:hypothetical protein [Actinomycetota bacterium]
MGADAHLRLPGEGIPVDAHLALVTAVKDWLAAVADPGRAPKMQAYVKSSTGS